MEPIQVLALGTTLVHIGLLLGVYLSDTSPQHNWQNDDAFVSTALDRLLYFKISLTMVIVFENLTCAVYVFFSHPPLSCYSATIAVLCFLVSLAGWTTVACTHMSEPSHHAGTIMFLLGSAGYSAFLLYSARRWKQLYIALWLAVTVCAVAFISLNAAQNYPLAALFEWVAFVLQGTALAIYFYDNPLKERKDWGMHITTQQQSPYQPPQKQRSLFSPRSVASSNYDTEQYEMQERGAEEPLLMAHSTKQQRERK
jgi:hypothetical protein